MGELSELTSTMRALKNVKEVELIGMPKLKSVRIGDGSFVSVMNVVFESECFDEIVIE